jgi:hypothetical protein
MLWTFARFGYQDETLMDMMHDIALKLQANCNSTSLAEVVYAMAQLGWADSRLHSLVADYAMDNIQVGMAVGSCSGSGFLGAGFGVYSATELWHSTCSVCCSVSNICDCFRVCWL